MAASSRHSEPPPIEGATHRFIEVAGTVIHYAEAGSGPPVMLLHGWPQHHYMWRDVIGGLRDRYHLIAPDLRGFGWSDAPGHGYDTETFAADQFALLDALGIDRVGVVGQDWGGWTGFTLALANPDRVTSLVACNTPHPWARPGPTLLPSAWRTWYAALNATPVLGPRALTNLGHVAGILRRGNVGTPFSDEEVELYVDQFRDPARARASAALYRHYWRTFGEVLAGRRPAGRTDLPILLPFGTHDVLVPASLALAGYKRHAPRMLAEPVPDSGHFIVNEKPELVARRARELLEPA